jgi:VanZ family protein
MWFKPKRWFFTVPVNFLQGFLLAGLTEYIQTFVPKRYGCFADVQLDYFGFLCSAILITIGFIIHIIVKKIRNKA